MSIVLVLTNSYDDSHVEAVQQHLELDGHTLIRLDTDRIVRKEHQIIWDYQEMTVHLITENATFDLQKVDSVWFRKPFGFGSSFGFVESIEDPVQRDALEKEIRDLIDSLCLLLANRFWINEPRFINQARLKPFQLHVARELDLPLPPTIVTNDPKVARAFCEEDLSIFKPISVPHFDYGENFYSVDTTLMTKDLINRLDLIKSQPVILQRFVDKQYELRVTCIGEKIFVAKQVPVDQSVTSATVDWRILQDSDATKYEVSELPRALEAKVHALMKRLNLGFAAIDFAVDKVGNYFFLEANPNGQWLGYTDEIGMPAAASIARCLVNQTLRLDTP